MSTTTMASASIVDAQLHLSLHITAGSMSCATSTLQTMKQTMRSNLQWRRESLNFSVSAPQTAPILRGAWAAALNPASSVTHMHALPSLLHQR